MEALNVSPALGSTLGAVLRSAPAVPAFTLIMSQRDVTRDLAPYVLAIRYTDYLSGCSDELEVELDDTAGRFASTWYPTQGDHISLRMGYAQAPQLPCGDFTIDEMELTAPPSVVRIRALATGIERAVRTRHGRGFENTTLAHIAAHIARRQKLDLIGHIEPIAIDRVTQWQQRDLEFLAQLAHQWGYVFKITGSKLVFSKLAQLAVQPSAFTLAAHDVASVRITEKVRHVPQRVEVHSHNPRSARVVSHHLSTPSADTPSAATSADTLKLHTRAATAAAASQQAAAALQAVRLQQTALTLVTAGRADAVAGSVLRLDGFGVFAGEYLMSEVRHTLDRASGWTCEISAQRLRRSSDSPAAGPHQPVSPSNLGQNP